MKKSLTALFVLSFVFLVSIFLTGCGANDKNTDSNQNDGSNTGENAEYDDLGLYSDDTKIVFNMQNIYYLVYYHNGTEITGVEYVYNYPSVETAAAVSAGIKANYEANDTVEKVELKGKRLTITFKKAAFEGETVESIRAMYSYLEEVKKK